MQITVKLFFEDEVRRVSIGDAEGELTITHLKSTIDTIFPALKHGDFRLLWKDEDGDLITISSNGEFLDAVSHMTSGGAISKFHVKVTAQKEEHSTVTPESESVHEGVQCDECGLLPIVGSRFKCSVRSDYDLCAKCEGTGPQPYPMIKMNAPKRSFSPIRGFPLGFGGRGGRGGGRFGGRCGDGGRFRGWFGGGESTDQFHSSPFAAAPPQAPHPWHHGSTRGHGLHHGGHDGRGPGPRHEPFLSPFGGPHTYPPQEPLHGEGVWGRGCGGWRDALRRRMEQGGSVPSSFPTPTPPPPTGQQGCSNLPVHVGVGCDECRMTPIVGPRYKCAVREDYDLCSGCEQRKCAEKGNSEKTLFPMLKIDSPEQAPGTFVYIFNKRAIHGGGGSLHGLFGHRGGYGGRGPGHHGHRHGHGHPHEADAVSSAVHRHVNCDQCGASPITGPRFKCAVRSDYDLCTSCAATYPQPFPMVKIYHPQHRPSTIVYAAALSAEKAARPATVSRTSNPVHAGVRCDECKVYPIVGARFQCTGRPNYDLCAGCEATKAFQPFPMVKIADPGQSPVSLVYEVQGGKPRATTALSQRPVAHHGVRCDQCSKSPIEGARYKCAVRDDYDLCSACEASSAQPYPVIKIYDPQHHPSKLVFAFNCKPEPTIATPVPVAAPAVPPVEHVPTTASAAAQLPRPSLRFVRDRSLPDGTTVLPGEQGLRKLWDVRNDGLHGWPVGSMLVFAGGDVLHRGAFVGEPVPLLQPGEEGQLAVSLTVPDQTGRYVSYYRMQTAEGQNFGQRLWADIVVASPPAPTAASLAAGPPDVRAVFVQGMDERTHGATAAVVAQVQVPVQEAVRAPFMQGMDEHTKELEMLQAVAALEEQEEEDRLLQQQLKDLNIEHGVEDEDEDEEELLLKQVMAEQTVSAAFTTAEQGQTEVPMEVSIYSIPADCVPAEAALSPVPICEKEEEERWALVASVEGLDDEDTSSEYSAGVHQPASTSASALLSAPRDMTASYDHACADLDVEVHNEYDGAAVSAPTSEEVDDQDLLDLEFVDALGASVSSACEGSSAAVESKEPEADSPRGVSSASPLPASAPVAPEVQQQTAGGVDTTARWHRELQMLMDMGFEDVEALIPLLEKHVRVPASARAESGVDALGLHAVLATLLN